MNLKVVLGALKYFQEKYPTSHVGGSIGLFLRGIDLKRDLSNSDLDVTIDKFEFDPERSGNLAERNSGSDFDFGLNVYHTEYGGRTKDSNYNRHYTKIDVRISPESTYDEIEYEGFVYKVSKLSEILSFKEEYSKRGYIKHTNDLITIKTGVRPIESAILKIEDGDLPF